MASQVSATSACSRRDDVIDNDGDLAALAATGRALHRTLPCARRSANDDLRPRSHSPHVPAALFFEAFRRILAAYSVRALSAHRDQLRVSAERADPHPAAPRGPVRARRVLRGEGRCRRSITSRSFAVRDPRSRRPRRPEIRPVQELERQKQSLERCATIPTISEEALTTCCADIEQAVSDLFQTSGKIGQELRENEWLMGIKQRTRIPGGVCEFDLPSYHYWLHQTAEQQRRDLDELARAFPADPRRRAIVLQLLRESGKTSSQIAQQGVYQQMMAGRLAQMLRLRLDGNYECVPEISANKYALNIRFTTRNRHAAPDQHRTTSSSSSRSATCNAAKVRSTAHQVRCPQCGMLQ